MTPRPPQAANPRALLDLLWLRNSSVGRSGLNLKSLLDAAIALADAEGLAALTMRRLAGEMGVGAMTLYSYIPGRSELLELMIDEVADHTYAEQVAPVEAGDWREALQYIAECRFTEAVSHGWVTELPPGRPVLGPGVCRRYELELAPLDGIGLSDVDMDEVLSAVTGLALHCARWQTTLDRLRTGSSDAQWWASVEPELASAMGSLELPISSRVGQSIASAGEPRRTLDTGLMFLSEGIERRLARGSATG